MYSVRNLSAKTRLCPYYMHSLTAIDRTATIARCRDAPIARLSIPRSSKAPWRFCLGTISTIVVPPVPYSLPAFRPVFTAWQGSPMPFRPFSFSRRSKEEKVPSLSESRPLRPMATFDTSPASFGIWGSNGYDAMVTAGTRLPCRETAIFESDFDYVEQDVLSVCSCPPLENNFIIVAKLPVLGIRKAKRKDSRIQLVMELDKDLTGRVTAYFTPQESSMKGEVSTTFDGAQGVGRTVEDVVAL